MPGGGKRGATGQNLVLSSKYGILSKFSTNPYLDSHLSKNINTWTIGTQPVGLAFTP